MKIQFNDNLRSSRGRYPVKDAYIIIGDDGRHYIEFSFSNEWNNECPVTLEDLAGCLGASHDLAANEICERIALFAQKSGPLFGQAGIEAVSDWQLAIAAAQEAIRLQQQVNGTRAWSSNAERVIKIRVSDNNNGPLFTYYGYFFRIASEKTGGYADSLPKDAWVRLFDDNGTNDYLYAKYSEEKKYKGFDIYVISCPSALSPELLAQTLCFVNGNQLTREELIAIGADKLADFDINKLINAAKEYERADAVKFEEMRIDKSDASHIQRIVQAIAALHLRRVTIDLFKVDNAEDALSFDTCLNSLWYSFAMQLGAVKVGYCEECGAGFSLTGHRGLPKRYCSDECRTKAKNRRERDKVSIARAMYMEGFGVEEIAQEHYQEKAKRVAVEDVVAMLARWPQLKQTIRAECTKPGAHSLAQRCCNDGIISKRQLELLEKRSTKLPNDHQSNSKR